MLTLLEKFKGNKRGVLCVFGAFLIQVCAGCYHGTFGNLLPYFTSYLKQVSRVQTDFNYSILIKDKSRFN